VQATVNGKKVNQNDEVFSVVWVNLAFRNEGSFSPDNAARIKIIEAMGQDKLGTYRSNGTAAPLVRTVVEIVGTVSPKNFQDKIILNRTKSLTVFLGEGFPLALKPQQASPADLSFSIGRDDDPSPNGKIYDHDAPGFPGLTERDIIHYRGNFQQFAVLGGQADDANAVVVGGKKASGDLPWFTRTSVLASPNGDVAEPSIAGDNISGEGTTRLTWNLQ
jgi:hypothetical protein